MSIQTFKESTDYVKRLKKSKYLLENFNDRIPVIIERSKKDKHLKNIDVSKYLIPVNMTILNVLILIRQKLTITEEQSIYIMVNNNDTNVLLSPTQSLEYIYNNYKCNDGFLYLEYCGENTFG